MNKLTIEEMKEIAQQVVASGTVGNVSSTDKKKIAETFVRILKGYELGLQPMQSVEGVNVIKGKLCLTACTMGSLISASERYDYDIIQHTDDVCEIQFFKSGKEYKISKFTMEDAKKADLSTRKNRDGSSNMWQKYPRNMLFARAISNGARWYCSDVFGGPVYTTDEIKDIPDDDYESESKKEVKPKKVAKKKEEAKPEPVVVLDEEWASDEQMDKVWTLSGDPDVSDIQREWLILSTREWRNDKENGKRLTAKKAQAAIDKIEQYLSKIDR